MSSPLVKICGITRLEDARLAAELGAWAVGFILYPRSPRFILPSAVRGIVDALPASLEKVGVLVNPTAEEARAAAKIAGLTRLQFHGDESPELCLAAGYPGLKALRLTRAEDLARVAAYRGFDLLIDAPAPEGVHGGTGTRADWVLAAQVRAYLTAGQRFWLAGGLRPENVGAAMSSVAPDGLDVSSGVESAPGVKDPELLRALFKSLGKKSHAT